MTARQYRFQSEKISEEEEQSARRFEGTSRTEISPTGLDGRSDALSLGCTGAANITCYRLSDFDGIVRLLECNKDDWKRLNLVSCIYYDTAVSKRVAIPTAIPQSAEENRKTHYTQFRF